METNKMSAPSISHWVCLGALWGSISLAAAQAPESVSEKDFLADMPIVLSVSRLPQRLDDTPGAVTLIDRNMIRLSGARDVADLLRLVPGFQSSTSFESGAPIASYHGTFERFSARIQVLVDGRSVYSPALFGGTGFGLQSVALEDIERIEVLRGSNSAAYGSRAMLGVVNIVTRHTVDTLGLQAKLSGGENGVRDVQTHIGWGQNGASFRLALDRRGDDGLSGANGHNQIKRVNFRVDLRATASDEIELRAGGLVIDSGKGSSDKPTSDPLRDRSFESGYLQLDWRRILGVDQDLALSMSRTQESHRDNFPFSLFTRLRINDSILIDFGSRTRSDVLTLQHTARHGTDVRLVVGGEIRREQVRSKPMFNTEAALVVDFTRLFGNVEWHFAPDLVLNAGALAEKNSESGNSVAPRLMLNWHLAPGQTLRAGISKAYRPPSTFEKYADIRYFYRGIQLPGPATRSSGRVEPESVRARELGYLAEFPRLGLNLDVRAFDEQASGFVEGTTGQPRDFFNGAVFSIKGLEYQLKARPWGGAQLIFNQAYIDIDADAGATAASAPKLASSLTLFQQLPGGLDLSLMHQHSGMAKLVGVGASSPFTRTDLRLGAPLRFGRNRGEVALVVQNLGMPYQDFAPAFTFQRRAFITLRVEN